MSSERQYILYTLAYPSPAHTSWYIVTQGGTLTGALSMDLVFAFSTAVIGKINPLGTEPSDRVAVFDVEP